MCFSWDHILSFLSGPFSEVARCAGMQAYPVPLIITRGDFCKTSYNKTNKEIANN